MELQNKRLGGFRPIYHTLLRQEETLESVVQTRCLTSPGL